MSTSNKNPGWLRPLWRRVAIVAVCAGWAALEFYSGSPGWAMIAGGMTLYGAWMYLYDWKDPQPMDEAAKE